MTSPRFEVDRIVCGDVLTSLQSLPGSSAQLIIADPPYNIGPKFGVDKEWQHDSGWIDWSTEWLRECQRVLRPDGNLFVYGIHHYLCYVQVRLYEIGMKYRRQIIWNYENGFSSRKRTLATHYEPLLWFSVTDDYFFSEIREPYKSQDRLKHRITKNGKLWTPHPDGRMAGDVWRFPTLAGRRFSAEKVDHPTQKPLALTERIVRHFSEPGSLIVVPFAGSGTECVAAYANGRHYWGCDINPDYVRLAETRVAETLISLEQTD
jgi:DNA modification methylase